MALRPFDQVVAEYGPMVLRVCRALLGPVDAEDAWSETFLAALRAYPDLDEAANVQAWLVTIAHRKAVDAIRAAARRPVVTDAVPEPGPGSRRTAADAQPAEWDDELWGALKALPPRQRAAVAYHYLAGLPYQEIAAITGGTVAAARKAASDGIRTLRATYAPARERGPRGGMEEERACGTRRG